MAAAIPPAVADRLVKLAGMLGSSFDGERANAAAAATRLLKDCDLTWPEFLAPAIARRSGPPPTGWRALVSDCLLYPDRLTGWERGFLASLRGYQRISEKQQAILERIAARIRAEDAR